MKLLIVVEDEPYPKSPTGRSAAIKLGDWLDLATLLEGKVELDVRPISELEEVKPDIVEAFTMRENLLTARTFPTQQDHQLVNDLRCYWPSVLESGVPAIPVQPEGRAPESFPVFVRGPTTSFGRRSRVATAAEFELLRSQGPVIVRPFVKIEACGARRNITKEARAHVVCSRCVCVEFLFPRWAADRPTEEEFVVGCDWTRRAATQLAEWSEAIAKHLACSWFAADFAQTEHGLWLVELNPGWCSGVTDPASSRAVHLAILSSGFDVAVSADLRPVPKQNVPFVGRA